MITFDSLLIQENLTEKMERAVNYIPFGGNLWKEIGRDRATVC